MQIWVLINLTLWGKKNPNKPTFKFCTYWHCLIKTSRVLVLLGVFPIAMWLQGSLDKVTNPLNSDLQSKTALEVTLFPFCEIAVKKLMLLEGSGGGSWAWRWGLGLWSHLRSFPLALICNNKYWQAESVIIRSFKIELNPLFWNFCEYNYYWNPIDSEESYALGFDTVWILGAAGAIKTWE